MDKIKNVSLKVVGVTFNNDDGTSRKETIIEMSKGNTDTIDVLLVREPDNKFDPNAIKVIANGKQIGYIGKDYSSILAGFMDAGRQFTAKVKDCGEFKNRPYCEILINEV